jgi:S-adenosylmethionine:tRNA ribosyltransferase-isomerase
MLSAFIPPAQLQKIYREAVDHRYLWHEFGDLHLILRH